MFSLFLKQLVVKTCTRFSSTSSGSHLPSFWIRTKVNCKHTFKILVGQPDDDIFNEIDVATRYILDKVSVQDWCLVYDNRGAAVFHKISSFGTPIIFFGISLLALDYWKTNGNFAISSFAKFYEDCVEAGYFTFIPVTIATTLTAFILCLQSKQLFRIYVNRQDPSKLRMLIAKGPMFRRWLDVTRFDIEPTSVLYKESGDYFRSLYEGQVKIKGKKYYLDVSSFRTNNIQSYIFRESNKIPTFLDAYDLDNEYIYMK